MNLIVAILISFSILSAQEQGQKEKKVFSLNDAIKHMIQYNGELASERTNIDLAQGRIDQARAGIFPKTELLLLATPIFEERGDAISTVKNYSRWGAFTAVKATIIQPIYTFGVLDEYRNAASKGYEVDTQKLKTKQAELVYRVKQLYYGLQLANDLCIVVVDAKNKMTEAIERAEEMLVRQKVKREDVFALKAYYAQVLTKSDEAERARDLAKKALAWTIGLEVDADYELDYQDIAPEDVELKAENDYVTELTVSRPELKMLDAGIEATKSLWYAQSKQKRPAFFFMGYGNLAYSNVRDDQKSAYANDPFNDVGFGFLFGLKFNLDWWTINSLAKQRKAEHDRLAVARDHLNRGMILELKKAYREVKDYKKAVSYNEEGQKNASKWMMNTMMSYGMGFNNEVNGLIDSLKAYFESELNYNLSIYQYNMALAELSRVSGREILSSIKY